MIRGFRYWIYLSAGCGQALLPTTLLFDVKTRMLEDPSYDFFAGTFDFDTPTVWLLAAVAASSLLWAGLLGLRFVHLAAWWAGGLAAGLLISIPFVLILPESKLRTLVVLTSLFLIAMPMATGRIKRSQQTRLALSP